MAGIWQAYVVEVLKRDGLWPFAVRDTPTDVLEINL